MPTHCNSQPLAFQPLATRKVVANFAGGRLSSDGGALLLGETEKLTGIINRFSKCFTDHRDPDLIEHSLENLLRQRIFGLCLGYEDLNDHDRLRGDALLATAVGHRSPCGEERVRQRDKGYALAGKSTLNRLELTPADATKKSRYKKIVANPNDISHFFVNEFVDANKESPPKRMVLDFDPSDIELYGQQEGRFYHGHYHHYCYLPMYVFCGEYPLMATLRKADIDGAAGTVEALEWLIPALRHHWPDTEYVIRGDGGFARESIFKWCEANDVRYIIGLPKNRRLKDLVADELAEAEALLKETGEPARVFKDLAYQTQKTWSRSRRVVAKCEQIPGKANPRFVVTDYNSGVYDAKTLYEQEYCARGEMENRIKEQQLDLFGTRTSSGSMRANQLRVWLSLVAHCLMVELRRTGLAGTKLASAQSATIRTRLLKVAARVRVSVRRVFVEFSSVFPLQDVMRTAVAQLQAAYIRAAPS